MSPEAAPQTKSAAPMKELLTGSYSAREQHTLMLRMADLERWQRNEISRRHRQSQNTWGALVLSLCLSVLALFFSVVLLGQSSSQYRSLQDRLERLESTYVGEPR